jgi:hypothetical protein
MPGTSVPEASYLDSCCELEGQCDISGKMTMNLQLPTPPRDSKASR